MVQRTNRTRRLRLESGESAGTRPPGSLKAAGTGRGGFAMLVFLTASFTMGPNAALAGVNRWTTHGPEGGWVHGVTVDPTNPRRLYATAEGGTFVSDSGGDRWSRTGPTLDFTSTTSLVVDPHDPDNLFAIGSRGGVFKSANGGAGWKQLYLPDRSFPRFLAIDPVTPERLYAVNYRTVLMSEDAGETWSSVGLDLPPGLTLGAFAVDPRGADTLYLGSDVSYSPDDAPRAFGMFKSADGGRTWRQINRGLPEDSRIIAIAVDPQVPETVYTALLSIDTHTSRGVYKSTNGGEEWAASGLENTYLGQLVIDPRQPSTLYAIDGGLLRSDDAGDSWVRPILADVPGRWSSLTVDPTDSSRLYLSTDEGIFRSSDAGRRWQPINRGLTNVDVQSIAVDPLARDVLYCGTSRLGAFRSEDGGLRWQALGTDPFTSVHALAVHFETSDVVYAGTNRGLLRSTDGGRLWDEPDVRLGYSGVRAVAVTPHAADVYVGYDDGRVFKSVDGGFNWTDASGGLPLESDFGSWVTLLLADPADDDTLYALTQEGPFKTVDGGDTWFATNTGLGDAFEVTALALAPSSPSTLYAASDDAVFRTNDAGGTWHAILEDLDFGVGALVVDPEDGDTLYAGGFDGGVFRSTNGGRSWGGLSNGLTGVPIRSLAIDPHDHRRLYAAAFGASVAVLDQRELPLCPGDCSGDGRVAVDELLRAVRAGLGLSVSPHCPDADANLDGHVRIDDLVSAVAASISGCGGDGSRIAR